MPKQGLFIVIEGGDGVGKSTQVTRLRTWLEAAGRTVQVFRDPGSTKAGEAIRDILLNQVDWDIDTRTEMFLFMAARAQLVTESILPALGRGEVVIQDRYLLSTAVYQGYAGGIPLEEIWSIGRSAIHQAVPDLTIVLDLLPEEARRRLSRPLDRMERKGEEYHRRVREGFLQGAEYWRAHFSGKIAVLDGGLSEEKLAEEIQEEVAKRLKKG